ncbi:MAG: NACHT domain-containing protein [Proteobacteria bacterium]|nr:NACHT domain-containing protein [Pseudomonadota bacterium]
MKKVQETKDKELFESLSNPETDLKSLLTEAKTPGNANVNCFDAKQGTPLIAAIKAHHTDHVKQLLEAKADVLGVDDEWHSALYYAFAEFKAIKQKNKEEPKEVSQRQIRLDILFSLIRALPAIDSVKIKQWVSRAERYWHDPDYRQSKTILLDALASCLLGTNVNVFCKEKFLIKYSAQLLSFKGTGQNQEGEEISFDTWSKDIYLMLRVRVLLGCLFHQMEKPNHSNQEIIKKILSEIQITLETYLIAMLCTQSQDISLSTKEKAELYKILTTQVIDRLSHLEEGQSYCLPTGWSSHAIYLVFTRNNQFLHLRLDNLGRGIDKHKDGAKTEEVKMISKKHSKKKKERISQAFPYPLGKIELSSNSKQLAQYLQELFLNYNKLPPHSDETKKEFVETIYNSDEVYDLGKGETKYYHAELRPRQTAKNCVYYNFQIGVEIRCDPELSRLIYEAECNFANPKSNYPILDAKWPLLKEFYQPQSILPLYLIKALRDYHQNHKIKVYQQEVKEWPGSLYTNLCILNKFAIQLRDTSTLEVFLSTIDPTASNFENWFDEKRIADQRILLEGEAGIGKSTLAERLAFLNATGRIWSGQFEAVLIVPLRILVRAIQNEKTLAEIVSDTITYLSQPMYAIEIDLLEKAMKANKILLILDGADEVSTERASFLSSPYTNLLSYSRQITTTRPYHLPDISLFSHQYRIIGFTSESAHQYTEKFFHQLETQNNKGEDEKKLVESKENKKAEQKEEQIKKTTLNKSALLLKGIQKNPAWYKLSRSPLLLSFCCSLIVAETETSVADMRISELYQGIFNILIYRFLQKNQTDFDQTITISEILQSPFARGPVEFLETLALEARLSKQSDITAAVLETVLKKCAFSRKITQPVLRIELLKPTTEDTVGISGCYFSHPTLQDFCIARQITKKLLSSDRSEALPLVQEHRYDFQYRLVWPFISGLLYKKSSRNVEIILNALLAEPRECGFYEIPILLSCIEECIPAITTDSVSVAPMTNSTVLTKIGIQFKAIFYRLVEEQKGSDIPDTWLEVLSKSPFFVRHIGLLDKMTAILNGSNTEQTVKVAYYLGCLIHFSSEYSAQVAAVLMKYIQQGKDKNWQEKALYALQKMVALSVIDSSQFKNFQSLLWGIVQGNKEQTTPLMRQIASEVLKKHFPILEQSLTKTVIDRLTTSQKIQSKIEIVDELLTLIPFFQETEMSVCIQTLMPLLKDSKNSSERVVEDVHKLAYTLSILYRLNPQKNKLLWDSLNDEFKALEAIPKAILATPGQHHSGFIEAMTLLQEEFDKISNPQQGIWMARFLVDQVKANTAEEKTVFSASVVKYLTMEMPEQIMHLPKKCWITNFPKDWKAQEIMELESKDKLNYLPPEALFLISESQKHQNMLLIKSFLKNIYTHGFGLILRPQEGKMIILAGDSPQSEYLISTESISLIQKQLSELFPILQWQTLQHSEMIPMEEEEEFPKQSSSLKRKTLPPISVFSSNPSSKRPKTKKSDHSPTTDNSYDSSSSPSSSSSTFGST